MMFVNLSDLLKIDQTLDKYMKLAAALLQFGVGSCLAKVVQLSFNGKKVVE